MAASTNERGYGYEHTQIRKAWADKLAAAGTLPCARCNKPITRGQPWDLGHNPTRTGYTGPEHVRCNRSAGGRNGRAKQLGLVTTRTWR